MSVDTAFNITDTAIYTEGNSGVLEVNVFEGSTSPTAGIDVQGQRNFATLWRNESSASPIRFGRAANFGRVLYDQSGVGNQFDNSNNRAINYATGATEVVFEARVAHSSSPIIFCPKRWATAGVMRRLTTALTLMHALMQR